MVTIATSVSQNPTHETHSGTLIITRREILRLLTLDACIGAVENAFRAHGSGTAPAPVLVGLHAGTGGFHIKAALLQLDRLYFAAKTNANFPLNRTQHGLPTIQGLIALCDAGSGYPLALMDSAEITRMRTAAASAVAARYLAREDAQTITILGCGDQAFVQLDAILCTRQIRRVHLHDADPQRALQLAQHAARNESLDVRITSDPESAVRESDICITCTPAKRHIIEEDWVRPGTFIAAVGADNEDKNEIDPRLMAKCKVVADMRDQCATIGDLHHAIAAGLMKPADIYAELGEIVAGSKAGRTLASEIIVFDSTGTALQDVAAAAVVYKNACLLGIGTTIKFNDCG